MLFVKLYSGEKIFAQPIQSGLSTVELSGPIPMPLIIPSHEAPCIAEISNCGSMSNRKTDDVIAGHISAPHPTISDDLRNLKQCQFHLDNSPPVFYETTGDSSGPGRDIMAQYETNAYTFYPPTRWCIATGSEARP